MTRMLSMITDIGASHRPHDRQTSVMTARSSRAELKRRAADNEGIGVLHLVLRGCPLAVGNNRARTQGARAFALVHSHLNRPTSRRRPRGSTICRLLGRCALKCRADNLQPVRHDASDRLLADYAQRVISCMAVRSPANHRLAPRSADRRSRGAPSRRAMRK
jgi:hypothetical protein